MFKISTDEIRVEIKGAKNLIKTNNNLLNNLKQNKQNVETTIYEAHIDAENKLFEIIKDNEITRINLSRYRLYNADKYIDPIIPNQIMKDTIGKNKSIKVLKLEWIDRINWDILNEIIEINPSIYFLILSNNFLRTNDSENLINIIQKNKTISSLKLEGIIPIKLIEYLKKINHCVI